jgi:hypothetical protein
VWLTAGAAGAVAVVVLFAWLLWPRDYLTGTNSVASRIVAGQAGDDQQFCVRGLTLPAGTGQVRFTGGAMNPVPSRVDVELRTSAGVQRATVRGDALNPPPGIGLIDIPVRAPDADSPLTVCLTPHDGIAWLGGIAGVQRNEVPPTLDGELQPNRIAVWYLPPAGEQRSLLSLLPTMFERAALFRPGIVGPWTYWLLFLVVLPALAIGSIALLARAAAAVPSRIPRALAVFAAGFTCALSFSLITPMFQAPDESEHFAAVQYLAETGKAVNRVGGPQSAYSDTQILAMEAVHHSSTIETASGRPPWLDAQEKAYERQLDTWRAPLSRANGGGFQPATSSHAPLFYALAAPAYLATESLSVPSQVAAIRVFTSLLAALTALFAYLTVRELMPTRQWAAVLAGLFVAFQPMFGFIGGAISNDNGVNTAAALLVFLLVRGLRRGLSWKLALALGATLALAPVLKGTAYFLYPVAALALLGMFLRGRDRRVLIGLATLAGAWIACTVAWALIAPVFGRTVITAPSGNDPTAGVLAVSDPVAYLAYVWQLFFPPIFGMTNIYAQRVPFVSIYIVRGWGAFGWYAILFPAWMTVAISVLLAGVTALWVKAMWRFRDLWRRYGWEALVLIAIPICVFLGVEAFYSSAVPRPGPVAEQGRYIFPAAVSLATGTVVACFAFGRRIALPLGTVFLVALVGLSLYARLVELAGFYT